jgi:hypothetical protein
MNFDADLSVRVMDRHRIFGKAEPVLLISEEGPRDGEIQEAELCPQRHGLLRFRDISKICFSVGLSVQLCKCYFVYTSNL